MSDNSSEEFIFSCPQCSFKQPVPVVKKGAAIVCKACNSTVFVPADQTDDDESEGEYGLSAGWEEPPKRSVPVYATEEGTLSIRDGTDDEDTVRELPETGDEDEEEEEEEEEGYHRPDLPESPMWTGVLAFLATKEAIVLAIGMAVAATLVLACAIAGMVFDDLGTTGAGQLGQIGMFFAGLALGTLGLIWAIWAFVCGLTVLQETAAGFDRIDGLPELSWTEWIANALFFFAPLATAAALGYGAATILPFGAVFWMSVFVFALFPVLFLSALDEQFWVGFASVRVYKSLVTARRAWGILYLYQFVLAGLLAAAVGIGWLVHRAMVGSSSWIIGVNLVVFCIAAVAAVVLLVYSRALGRLVRVISETEKALARGEEDEEVEEADEEEGGELGG